MQLNPMITCESCSGYFHQYCYGIEEEELINCWAFKCDRCKERPESKCCYICRKKQASLPIKLVRGQWFHPSCIVLYDYLSPSRPLSLADTVTLEQINREIDPSKECALCLKRKGRMTQCRECEKHYHLLCAYLSGFEVTVAQKDRKVQVSVACGVHTISLQKLVEQIFLRRNSLNLDGATSFDSTESYYEHRLKEGAQFKQIKKIFECELIELMPRKKIKPNA